MCRGEIFLSPEFGTELQREVYPYLWRYPNSVTTHKPRVASKPETSLIRSAISTQYGFVTDGHTAPLDPL